VRVIHHMVSDCLVPNESLGCRTWPLLTIELSIADLDDRRETVAHLSSEPGGKNLEDIEVGGLWWLPGREDRKVPGTFTFDTEHGGRLTLVGALRDNVAVPALTEDGDFTLGISADDVEAAGTYDWILGLANGTFFTLQKAFETNRSGNFWEETNHQVIQVGRTFRGAHFNDTVPASGNELAIQLEGLSYWVGRSGLTSRQEVEAGSKEPRFILTGKPLETDSIQLTGGGNLHLEHWVRLGITPDTLTIRNNFQVKFSYGDPQPVDELLDVASDLQDLVSIGIGGAAEFEHVGLYHPDVYFPVGDTREPEEITVGAHWTAVGSGDLKPRYTKLVFNLREFGGLTGVARWLAVAQKHRSTLSRVMATYYATNMYVSDRYLNRLAALEALDRTEGGEKNKSFERRLKWCVTTAGPAIDTLVDNTDAWIATLVSDRNDIAHHFGRRLREESAEQFFLAESAYWLYILCLLRLSDAPDAVFDDIVQHEKFQLLKRRLARFL
jgi:hypothetical protein